MLTIAGLTPAAAWQPFGQIIDLQGACAAGVDLVAAPYSGPAAVVGVSSTVVGNAYRVQSLAVGCVPQVSVTAVPRRVASLFTPVLVTAEVGGFLNRVTHYDGLAYSQGDALIDGGVGVIKPLATAIYVAVEASAPSGRVKTMLAMVNSMTSISVSPIRVVERLSKAGGGSVEMPPEIRTVELPEEHNRVQISS